MYQISPRANKVVMAKKRYFNFTFQSESDESQGVCFSPEKHKLFNSIAGEEEHVIFVWTFW